MENGLQLGIAPRNFAIVDIQFEVWNHIFILETHHVFVFSVSEAASKAYAAARPERASAEHNY